jgi:flagellar motor switch protein FliN/FliY
MSIINDITADNRLATAVVAALENALGGDLILGVGRPRTEPPTAELVPPPPVRVVRVALTQGASGGAYVALADSLAQRLEAGAPDSQLVTGLAAAFDTVVTTMHEIGGEELHFGAPLEVALDELLAEAAFTDREHATYSLLDGDQRVGAFVVSIGAAIAAPVYAGAIDAEFSEAPLMAPAPIAAAPSNGNGAPHVSLHQFQQLGEGGGSGSDPRALALLHDVEMGVTAELGRRRMTVRDLLALTPGSVIELDRAAGSPVDVLVNGTLIARGEVVVIDEEFGIRISEIVGLGSTTAAANAA